MIDQSFPQPKDPDILAGEKICQQIRELAREIAPSTTITFGLENGLQNRQFGNNFFLLFSDMLKEKSGADPSSKPIVYLNEVEKLYGQKWQDFLKENDLLITAILEKLKKQKLINKLSTLSINLLQNPKTRELALKIDEEINLGGLSFDLWKELNPLLEQASEAMIAHGMDPKLFGFSRVREQ